MEKRLIVDRIENDIAACETENRDMLMLPCSILPSNVAEGDCLYLENGTYYIDQIETLRRREENFRLMQSLIADDN